MTIYINKWRDYKLCKQQNMASIYTKKKEGCSNLTARTPLYCKLELFFIQQLLLRELQLQELQLRSQQQVPQQLYSSLSDVYA